MTLTCLHPGRRFATRQASIATSPPPTTTTVSGISGRSPAFTRRRNPTPSTTRSSSSPGIPIGLPHHAPMVSSTASWRSLSSSEAHVAPERGVEVHLKPGATLHQPVDVLVDDAGREPEGRDPPDHHAPEAVRHLVDVHRVAGDAQSRARPRARPGPRPRCRCSGFRVTGAALGRQVAPSLSITKRFIVPMPWVPAAICIEETPVVARPIIVGSIAGREHRKRQLAQARLEDPPRANKGHAGSTELKSRVEHRPRQHVVMTLDLFREPAERGLADGGVTHGSTGASSPSLDPARLSHRFAG